MAKFNWVVLHQFDTEPTYVVEQSRKDNVDFDDMIEFPTTMDPTERVAAARFLADYLNREQVDPIKVVRNDPTEVEASE
jgi:DNA polymerase elongation subunit (family B)